MQQVGVLASLNHGERVWLEEVTVGEAVVKLGLNPGRQARGVHRPAVDAGRQLRSGPAVLHAMCGSRTSMTILK